MNVNDIIDTLRAAREEALAMAERCAQASAIFQGTDVAAAKKAPAKLATKTKGKAKPVRVPKAAKPSKAPKTVKAAKPADDDEPRARKGHVPKVGVQQLYCATLKERQEATGKLKAAQYRRIGPGEPLTAGTYDVRPSGDEDESCVVLWRAKSEEVAA